MINDIVFFHMLEDSRANKCNIFLFSVGKAVEYTGRIMNCTNQFYFRNVELFGSLQKNIT